MNTNGVNVTVQKSELIADDEQTSVSKINLMIAGEFEKRFKCLFEHSPWIIKKAEKKRPFSNLRAMHQAMIDVVIDAGVQAQIDLFLAHPELADKVAMAQGLTTESAGEQASAGLNQMTPEMFDRFHQLNRGYRERYGFPFIICVRLTNQAGIIAAMSSRLHNNLETEIETALNEVGKIVWLRLNDIVQGGLE